MTQQQAEEAAELVAFFLHDDREEEETPIPGPYEQGANQVRRDTMGDLFGADPC